MTTISKLVLFLLLVACVAGASPVSTFDPACVTNNSGICSSLLPQIHLTVTDNGNNDLTFLLTNDLGGLPSSIDAIYFETPLIGNLIIGPASPGVSFSLNGTPGNPPSGNNVNFNTAFYATADPPPSQAGVNPGEFLTLDTTLANGASTAGALDDTRVAVHVIGFQGISETLLFSVYNGVSESAVPEPASIALIGLGLIGLGLLRKRIVRKA